MQDLEVFKQIPGYKAILKAVLKNQIQSLVHQLALQTGEESVLITASLEEGTLTQLGSEFGKTFLEGHDEIKSQFLGFCLKRKQIQKQTKEFQESKPRKSWSARRPHAGLPISVKSEPYPVSMTTAISQAANQKAGRVEIREHGRRKPSKTIKTETRLQYIKPEADDFDTVFTTVPKDACGEGDSEYLENKVRLQLTPITTVANEQMMNVSNVMASKGSAESIYTDNSMDTLSPVDNQSPDSAEGTYEGTDSSDPAADETVNMSEQIVAGQEQYSVNDEVLSSGHNQIQDHGDQGHTGQGEGHVKNEPTETADNLDTSMATFQEYDVTSLNETIEERKPKLKLFNRNRKSNIPKSLKERKAELENYLNLENTDRPYPCNLCPKRFKERHHLVYHLRTHSGHRPYVCSICNKGFTQSSSLNTHKKLHLKDMSCEFCGLVFRKISLLQNHVCRALSDLNSTI